MRSGAPEISVLIPLEDAKGDAAAHVATWARAQTLARERFQVVVASGGSPPELLARVADLLAPQDVLLQVPGADEIALWNAAAAAASAPWLVITESHCLAEPTCLEAVMLELARKPDLLVARLSVESVVEGRLSAAGGRWIEQSVARWDRPWSPIRPFGTVIRASLFADLGGLEERADQFAMALLGARVHHRGLKIGHIRDARVKHLFGESARESARDTLKYTRGECDIRAQTDPASFEQDFGSASELRNRYGPKAPRVRALIRALAAAVRDQASDAGWLTGELLGALPALVSGRTPQIFVARVAAACNEQAVRRLPLTADLATRTWSRAHDQRVRQARLQWARAHTGPLPDVTVDIGHWPVELLEAPMVVGVHGLESEQGRRFRWTKPVVHLRIAPAASTGAIVLETMGLRGPPLGYVRAVLTGSRMLEPDQLSDDGARLSIELCEADLRRARRHGLTILSRPLLPMNSQDRDDRRLGIPLYSAETCAR